ncbi:MAG: hypothetical protein E6G56_00720 [Actinobacteria bacterium]|nr:MAG: hypothetical protein E6G56_00720 [Actinomycetota bacterium]
MATVPFTRRGVVVGALAGLGWLLTGRGRLPAAAATPAPRVSSRPLTGRWRPDGEGWLRREPVYSARPVDVAGVQWEAPADVRIELRALGPRGWSPWVAAGLAGHGPDAAPATRAGEPVWCAGARAVQVRASRALRGARAQLVAGDPVASARDWARERLAGVAALALLTPRLDAGPGQPAIIARRVWAGAAERPHGPIGYGRIALAFVHHTENANGYGRHEVPALLRAIAHYHRDVLGWKDIGYNFLVDRYGRVWEGRAGGAHDAVVGAQAGAYNTASTGVAVLGSFQSELPPTGALRALAHLLAWKLALHGQPTGGRVRVRVDPDGAQYTPFRGGAHVFLPRIAGHRDGDSTDCPGDRLYHRLPALRRSARRLTGSRVSLLALAAPASPGPYLQAPCGGRLIQRDGSPISGATVLVQVRGPRSVAAGHASTAPDGSWTTQLSLPHSAEVRALFAGDGVHAAAVSEGAVVAVSAAITLSASPQPASLVVAVAGAVEPAKPAVVLDVYASEPGGSRLLASDRFAAAGGRYSGSITVPAPGSYRLIARTRADDLNAAGSSTPVDITVAQSGSPAGPPPSG